MKKFDPVQLSYFTGTEKYYQLSDATPFGQTPLLRQNPNVRLSYPIRWQRRAVLASRIRSILFKHC